jgi:hypothetical protein
MFQPAHWAGILAAVSLLEAMGSSRRGHELKKRLSDPHYASLFDAMIGESGGWAHLAGTIKSEELDRMSAERRKAARLVADTVDYQFRYHAHGGADAQIANISHARFYLYKGRPKIGWKSSSRAWVSHKRVSIFIYVSESIDKIFFQKN